LLQIQDTQEFTPAHVGNEISGSGRGEELPALQAPAFGWAISAFRFASPRHRPLDCCDFSVAVSRINS